MFAEKAQNTRFCISVAIMINPRRRGWGFVRLTAGAPPTALPIFTASAANVARAAHAAWHAQALPLQLLFIVSRLAAQGPNRQPRRFPSARGGPGRPGRGAVRRNEILAEHVG